MALLPVHMRTTSLNQKGEDDPGFYLTDNNNRVYEARPVAEQAQSAPYLDNLAKYRYSHGNMFMQVSDQSKKKLKRQQLSL